MNVNDRPDYLTDEMLAHFREALESPNYSHVSTRPHVGRDVFWVYHHDHTSPSGVLLASGAADCAESRAILDDTGRRSLPGPQRGRFASL